MPNCGEKLILKRWNVEKIEKEKEGKREREREQTRARVCSRERVKNIENHRLKVANSKC